MKKWYRILNAFAAYSRGDIIAPEGLNRESLQVRGWITRQPVYIGPRKPTEAEVEAWGKPVVEPQVEPEPAVEAVALDPTIEPEPEPAESVTAFGTAAGQPVIATSKRRRRN